MVQASLKRYFLTGLLVIIPIWGTILILKTLFVSLDGILGDVAARFITPGRYVPGLGIVALILSAVQDRPAAEVAAIDIAEALEPFDLKRELSSNRTQGVPNMIALVRETAARLAS